VLVAGRDSGLSQAARDYLKNLDKPLHMQVFVTLICPYCTRAVLLAHQMAMEKPGMIQVEGVEGTEFPELSSHFVVSGVPQTTINVGTGIIIGTVPVNQLLSEISRVLAN
jgi:alkyl hydroperoxide reductase subunit AhpF